MKRFALLLVVAFMGCGSVETKDESRPVVADPPPPAAATVDLPEFGDPKPPIAASSKRSKEPESTRDSLLHVGGR